MESDLNAAMDNLFESQVFTTHAGALPRPVHVSPLLGQRYLGATLTPFRFEARLVIRVDAIPPLFAASRRAEAWKTDSTCSAKSVAYNFRLPCEIDPRRS